MDGYLSRTFGVPSTASDRFCHIGRPRDVSLALSSNLQLIIRNDRMNSVLNKIQGCRLCEVHLSYLWFGRGCQL